MNKPAFHEEYISPKTDPLHTSTVEFPYDDIDERVFGKNFEAEAEQRELERAELLKAFRSVFEYCLTIDTSNKNSIELVGRRFIALAWVMHPGLFEGGPSLRELSKRFHTTARVLASLTGEATRKFGITNRAQAHAWNRAKATPLSDTLTLTPSSHSEPAEATPSAAEPVLKPVVAVACTPPLCKESFTPSSSEQGPKQAGTRVLPTKF